MQVWYTPFLLVLSQNKSQVFIGPIYSIVKCVVPFYYLCVLLCLFLLFVFVFCFKDPPILNSTLALRIAVILNFRIAT